MANIDIKTKNIFISAGDYSGDMHASYLVDSLITAANTKNTNLKIAAVGGMFLQASDKVELLENIVQRQGFGFSGLIKQYFYFKNLLNKKIIPYLKDNEVELVIIVDFYGFNIHLAEAAKRLGIKVIYYISPQIWASRKSRIYKIKKFVDAVIPILPFEKKIYEDIGVKTFYAGNPLVDVVEDKERSFTNVQDDAKKNAQDDSTLTRHSERKRRISIRNGSIINKSIAFMPGSRVKEIKNILPMFMRVISASKLRSFASSAKRSFAQDDASCCKFYLILPKSIDRDFVDDILKDWKFKDNVEIVEGPAYDIRRKVRFIMMSSGTATVENIILNTPMMIFYKLDKFSYFIAKLIAKIKFIGMPNILAGKEIMPEYIQNIDYSKVGKKFSEWLKDDNLIEQKKDELKKLKAMLKIDKGSVLDNISKYILQKFL